MTEMLIDLGADYDLRARLEIDSSADPGSRPSPLYAWTGTS
jgi:hypothetical protein